VESVRDLADRNSMPVAARVSVDALSVEEATAVCVLQLECAAYTATKKLPTNSCVQMCISVSLGAQLLGK